MTIIQTSFVKQVILDLETGNIGWQTVTLTVDDVTNMEVAPRANHRGSFDAFIPEADIPFPPELLAAINLAAIRTPEKIAASLAKFQASTQVGLSQPAPAVVNGLPVNNPPPGPTV